MSMDYVLTMLTFVLLVWCLFGFIAFILEALRSKCYTKFDEGTKEDFIFIMAFGVFSFIVEVYLFVSKLFKNAMDALLRIINEL